jgi:hypothetical protein
VVRLHEASALSSAACVKDVDVSNARGEADDSTLAAAAVTVREPQLILQADESGPSNI